MTTDKLDRSVQCAGSKRYAIPCQRWTVSPSGVCYQHEHQEEWAVQLRAGACPNCGGFELIGHEVRGVYDGVLYWVCGTCDFAWNRWPEDQGRRHEAGEAHVALHNERRAVGIVTGSLAPGCDQETTTP